MLKELVEVDEGELTVDSGLAAVEHHKHEDEVGELVVVPFINLVEVLEEAVNEEVELDLFVGEHVGRKDNAETLECFESKLDKIFINLIFVDCYCLSSLKHFIWTFLDHGFIVCQFFNITL